MHEIAFMQQKVSGILFCFFYKKNVIKIGHRNKIAHLQRRSW